MAPERGLSERQGRPRRGGRRLRAALIAAAAALPAFLCPAPAAAQGVFIRGDCDQNLFINITDPIFLLLYLFSGGSEPMCLDACDGDDNERLEITDPIMVLNFLFVGSAAPGPPHPLEDLDPAGDFLDCRNGLEPPADFRVIPAELRFPRIGNAQVLTVLARNAEGQLEDVRTSPSTRYESSAPAVAEAGPEGIVTATGVGTADISVRFRGVTRTVPAIVAPGADGGIAIRISSPVSGSLVTSARVPVSGAVSDPAALVRVAGAPVENDAGWFRTSLDVPLGPSEIEVTAEGAAGTASTAVTITRVEPGSPEAAGPDGKPLPGVVVPHFAPPDTTPPSVGIASPAEGAILRSGLVDVTGISDDPLAEVRVNGVLAEREGAGFRARIRLAPGPREIVAEAVDATGNRAEASRRVTIDATSPRLALTEPAGRSSLAVRHGALTVRGTVDPPSTPVDVNGVAAQVTGGTWSAVINLAPGSHDIIVTASLPGTPPRRRQLARSIHADGLPPDVDLAHPPEDRLLSAEGFRADAPIVRFAGRIRDLGVPRELEGQLTIMIGPAAALISGGTFTADVPVAAGLNLLPLQASDARGNTLSRTYRVVRGGAAARTLSLVAGDGQTLTAGQAAPVNLVASAFDEAGLPRPGTPLIFRVALGDGTLDEGARSRQVLTGSDGRATVRLFAGTVAGAGGHVVTVAAGGFANAPIAFIETVAPAATRVLAAHGRRFHAGTAGEDAQTPLEARVLDGGGNAISGAMVTFRVIEGSATLGGAAQVTIATDAAGVAATPPARLPAGADSTSIVEATHPGTQPVRFELRGLAPGPPADTAVSGSVLDELGQPVAGAAVGVAGLELVLPAATTDASGGFRIEGAPAGDLLLHARGASGHADGSLRVTAVAGRESPAGSPIRCFRVGAGALEGIRSRTESVSPTRGALLSLAALPGLRVEIEPGAVTFPDGGQTGTVTLLAPNLSSLPAPSPDDIHVDVPLALLPEGARFDPPARITAPAARSRAGSAVPLYLHRAAAATFVELAAGVAAEDATAITSGAARGLREGGVFFFSRPGPLGGRTGTLSGRVELVAPGLAEVPQRAQSRVLGFNVLAHSGELFIDETDLELPSPGRGLIHFRFRRRYESRHDFRTSLGWNWEHEYEDRRLVPGLGGGNVTRASGDGRFDEYMADLEGGGFVSPPGVFARLFREADGFLIEREPDGTRYRHHPLDGSVLAGKLESITDRLGTRLLFARDPATGRITEARDVFGRTVVYARDPQGRLASITDSTGRTVRFGYDAAGDLVSVTRPAVLQMPSGNNFPDGVRFEYGYSSGFADGRLNHNVVRVIDPREAAGAKVPRVTIAYGETPGTMDFDRVTSQVRGGTNSSGVPAGGTVAFEYESFLGPSAPILAADELASFFLGAAGRTTTTDQEGRVTQVVWSGAGLPISERLHTQESFYPRDPSSLHPPPGIAPPFYETRWSWTREGLLASRMEPRGDRRAYRYDEGSPIRHAQAALIREEHHPAPTVDGPGAPAVTTYRRDPLFGEVVETVTPRGNDPGFEPPLGGPATPERYATRRILDYQEGTELTVLAAEAGTGEADLAEALLRAGMTLLLGDVNGDGDVAQRSGNTVKETPPPATLPDLTVDDSSTTLAWNRFGQLVIRRDGAGREVRWHYHSERDPDGDGTASTDSTLDPVSGGFLARRSVVPGDGGGVVETRFTYDPRGLVASRTDPNGFTVFFVWNQLGWIDEERLAPPLRYRRHFIHDANGDLVRLRIENYTSTDGGGHFLVSDNRWIDTDIERDLLGRPVTVTREVSEGEVGPARSITTRYRWSPSGALARAIHPIAGSDETWTRDERNLETGHARGAGMPEESLSRTIRDENGNAVLSIDAADTDGDGEPEVTERRHDGFGRLVAVIDPAGGARVFERDIEGNVIAESFLGAPGGAAGGNGDGNVLLERTCRAVDERGRVFEVRRARFAPGAAEAVELVERTFRDGSGLVARRIDPEGGEWTYERDGAGRLAIETDPRGAVRRFTYDRNGNVRRELRELLSPGPIPGAPADDPDYDAEGRFREVQSIVRVFDGLNRITALVDPAGGTWRARYDSLGNRILITDAGGTPIDAATDPELAGSLDLLTQTQRLDANAHGNRRRYVYDNLGRLVEAQHELRSGGQGGGEIDPTNPFDRDGIITERFEWDDMGRLLAWTNDAGNRTEVRYDAAGLVTRKTWPDGTFALHQRDRDGHLAVLTDENGTRFRQTFDALGRVVERTIERAEGVGGTTLQRFERDGLSRVTLAFDDNDPADPADDALVCLRYDSEGNVVEESQGPFSVATEYDAGNRPVRVRYPDGRTVEMARDPAGRIASLSDAARVYAEFERFGSGRLLEERSAPGLTISFLRDDVDGVPRDLPYDRAGSVLERIYRDGAGTLVHGFEYGRDRNGYQLYEVPFHRVNQTGEAWRYDSVYRLRTWLPNLFEPRVPPPDPLEKLVFYPDGNHSWRLVEVDFSQRLLSVNERSAYVESGSDSFTYDARGNLRTAGNLSFTYDALGRLLEVVRNGQVTGRHRHDAFGAATPEDFPGKGRRIRKDVLVPVFNQPAGPIRYTFSGRTLLEERSDDGNLLRQFLHADGAPAALLVHGASQSPVPYSLLRDAAGSVTGVADPLGAVLETVRYGAHGSPRITTRANTPAEFSAVGNAVGYGGSYHDYEHGLIVVCAKHFDPNLGRYLADTSPLFPARPLELNGYLLPALPGLPGEVLGAGSARRAAPELDPFRVTIPRTAGWPVILRSPPVSEALGPEALP